MFNKGPESKLRKGPRPIPEQPYGLRDDNTGKNCGSCKLQEYLAPQVQRKPPEDSQKHEVRKIAHAKLNDEPPSADKRKRKVQYLLVHEESVTRFSNKQAMVSGPTPPGTGVIALALFATLLKSTSPVFFPCSTEVPRSMTTAPFFTIEPLRSFAVPVPEITISAWRVNNTGFFVCLLIFVTVAFSLESHVRRGSPTRRPEPMRATRFPLT